MGKSKPIAIKEIHTSYSEEDIQETINNIQELLAEAFFEYYHNEFKHNPLN